MKKLLALVLALVMTLGLATVGSNAALSDFKDADKIDADYTEAVTVMNALGVFIGDENGFRPQDTLTRAEGAKLAAYFVTNQSTADGVVGTGKFSDVPATNWAAGYIELCQSLKILAGVGDNKFNPQGALTAAAFAKMMAVALGYDPQTEGFYSDTWALRAMTIANREGLLDGLNGIKATDTLTREQAAQMTFNTIKTPLVTSTVGTQIKVNDALVEVGATAPKYETTTKATEQTISKATETNTGNYFVEYGERYFTGLKLDSTTFDAFGRPTHTWSLTDAKGARTILGSWNDEATLFYSAPTKISKIYSDLGMTKTAVTNEFMIDGKAQDNFEVTKTGSWLDGTGKGVAQFVYVDYDKAGEPIISIYEINTYVGGVAKYKDDTVTVSALSEKTPTLKSKDFSTKETFTESDIIAFTAAYNTASKNYVLQSVDKLTVSDSGVISKWTGSKVKTAGVVGDSSAFTANDTDYSYSAQAWINPDNEIANFKAGKTNVDVYLDEYGYCLYLTGAPEQANYAAVIGIGDVNQYGSQIDGVTLLLADGSIKQVTAKQAKTTQTLKQYLFGNLPAAQQAVKVGDKVGVVVTYTVGDDGVYTLELPSTTSQYTDTSGVAVEEFKSGASSIKLFTSDLTTANVTRYATEKTVFFVAKWDTAAGRYTYGVYTGYNAMPTLYSDKANDTLGAAWATNAKYTTQVDAVYICANDLKGVKTADVIFVKAGGDGRATEKGTKTQVDYYTLPAIVKGEETEIKVSTGVLVDGVLDDIFTKNGGPAIYAANSVVKNADDIIIAFHNATAEIFDITRAGVGVVGQTTRDGRVVLGVAGNKDTAQYWAFDNKTVGYTVDKDYSSIKLFAVDKIVTDANDKVWAGKDSESLALTHVLTVDVDDNKGGNAATSVVVKNNVVPGVYGDVQFYTEDGHTITYAEASAALIAQMTKDGCVDIKWTSARTLQYTYVDANGVKHEYNTNQTILALNNDYTTINNLTYQVYQIKYVDLTTTGADATAYVPVSTTAAALQTKLTANNSDSSYRAGNTVVIETAGNLDYNDITTYGNTVAGNMTLTKTGATNVADALKALLTKRGALTLKNSINAAANNIEIPAGTVLTLGNGVTMTTTGDLLVKGTLQAGATDVVTLNANNVKVYGLLDAPKANVNGTTSVSVIRVAATGSTGTMKVDAIITPAVTVECTLEANTVKTNGLTLTGDSDNSVVTITKALKDAGGNALPGTFTGATMKSANGGSTLLTLPEKNADLVTLNVVNVEGTNNTVKNAEDIATIKAKADAGITLSPSTDDNDKATTVTTAIEVDGDFALAAPASTTVAAVNKGTNYGTSATIKTSGGVDLVNNAPTTDDAGISLPTAPSVTTNKLTVGDVTVNAISAHSSKAYLCEGDTITVTFNRAVKMASSGSSTGFGYNASGSTVTVTVQGTTTVANGGTISLVVDAASVDASETVPTATVVLTITNTATTTTELDSSGNTIATHTVNTKTATASVTP